jgi:hypothetical protein
MLGRVAPPPEPDCGPVHRRQSKLHHVEVIKVANILYKFRIVWVGLAVLLLLLLSFPLFKKMWPKMVRHPMQKGCIDEVREVEISDNRYMSGLLESGKTYEFLMSYYKCNKPQVGDIVLYRFSSALDPVVKVIRAVEGDRFDLEPDKIHGGWNLLVNGDKVMYGETAYFFGASTKPTLALYQESRNSVLKADEVIVLSNVPPGKDDSGTFGVVGRNDLVGKLSNKQ